MMYTIIKGEMMIDPKRVCEAGLAVSMGQARRMIHMKRVEEVCGKCGAKFIPVHNLSRPREVQVCRECGAFGTALVQKKI